MKSPWASAAHSRGLCFVLGFHFVGALPSKPSVPHEDIQASPAHLFPGPLGHLNSDPAHLLAQHWAFRKDSTDGLPGPRAGGEGGSLLPWDLSSEDTEAWISGIQLPELPGRTAEGSQGREESQTQEMERGEGLGEL